jgi:uncharacterized protein involved in exopolysaccharide biosynthesis
MNDVAEKRDGASSLDETPAKDTEDLDLAVLSRLLWRKRRLMAVGSLIGALLFGIWAFTAQPWFRAQVVVTPTRERNTSGAGALATELGGLASLAGVDIAPGALGNMQTSAAILDSRYLAEEFVKRNGLLSEMQRGSSKKMTLWRATDRFKKGVLTIVKDQRKGVTTVTIEWTDPATTARWANGYVALANELIRNRALQDATHNIAYLNEQLAKSTDVDLRKVMYNLIENETKTLMLANGRAEYAFQVVDPAVAPELKAGPHRILLTLIGFTIGFGLAAVIALMSERIGRHRRGAPPAVQHERSVTTPSK